MSRQIVMTYTGPNTDPVSLSWIKLDIERSFSVLTVQVAVVGTINYSMIQTADVLEYAAAGQGMIVNQNPAVFSLDTTLTSQTTNRIFNVPFYSAAIKCVINSSSVGGSLTLTVIQQGLIS